MSKGTSGQQPALPWLALGALGVVFGDIGTDGLYVMAACFKAVSGAENQAASVIGIISLILWSVILVVCVKYMGFIMRADHHGEGGTLALLGMLRERREKSAARHPHLPRQVTPGALTFVVIFGAALLYGDGMITPAISVLSAVQGLSVATTAFNPVVVPLSVGILIALFLLQSRGTEHVGKLFGPVMCVWFITIGVLGARALWGHPAILSAFDPRRGLDFLFSHGWQGVTVLGAVVLAVTGCAALYADLGHFGRAPIMLAWFGLAFPALVLNYLGQGAVLIGNPKAASNAFFALVPHWGLYPMVGLATAAAVIASQALISGSFSLTQQAVNMDLCPRFAIRHTSKTEAGQIYLPVINVFLMIGCTGIVLAFRSSTALSSAYGMAVVGTMLVTSGVFYLVLREIWHWRRWQAIPLVACFLIIDGSFLGGNIEKLLSGAWVPLAIACVVFTVSAIWAFERPRYQKQLDGWAMPVAHFKSEMQTWRSRQDGTAVLMTPTPEQVPMVGRHRWLRRQVNHENIVLLTVAQINRPSVAEKAQVEVETLAPTLHRMKASYGYMQSVDVEKALQEARRSDVKLDWDNLVFYLPAPFPARQGRWLHRLRRRLFFFLRGTGESAVAHFHIQPGQTVSVGLEVDV